MTARTLGQIEEFVPGKSVWMNYMERVEFFFTANDITEDVKKRAVFLSAAGPALYSIVRSLVTPQTPSEVTFKSIVDKLNQHFSPKPSEILSRFKFNKRDQLPSETVSEFLAEMRRLSEHCNFDSQLDSMLRDRLVCGLKDANIQRRMLADSKLTLKTATDMALSGEAAASHASEIRGTSSEIHNVKFSKQRVKPEAFKPVAAKSCFRCGEVHPYGECKYLKAVCYFCRKIGHRASVCNAKKKGSVPKKNFQTGFKSGTTSKVLSVDTSTEPPEQSTYSFYNLDNLSTVFGGPPLEISVRLNSIEHKMEIDSGSLYSVMSTATFKKLWPVNPPEIVPVPNQRLQTWSSEKLDVKGYCDLWVSRNSLEAELPLLVVQGSGKSLLGRGWFRPLGIEVKVNEVVPVNFIAQKPVDVLLSKYARIFTDELGKFKGNPVTIEVEQNCATKFFRARQVPLALRCRVEKELDNMVQKGILESISSSEWATPVVPVVKKDGTIRLCGDYRCTVNRSVKPFTYPLPTVNEVLSTVAGGTVFSKLDLSQAYLQLPVDDATSRLLTLNTHKGLFRVKRLPFGVSIAVSVFQKKMEEVFAGVEGVLPYLDDIYIKGSDLRSHNLKLEEVLQRLEQAGLRLKKEKCRFAVPEIVLLGFRVNERGIQPTIDKVTAIQEAPCPTNIGELQAFLGLLNFYGCFLKNRSEVLEPLHRLLQKEVPFKWTAEHEEAYKAAKRLLTADDLLVHYNENLPLILTSDASSYGLGSVLSHLLPEGKEAPVAYYSRTMTKTERNYSQTDKEALAILSGVKKFHSYLLGRKFKIVTDHKPLLGIFNSAKPIPLMISPRVLRWSLCLQAYDYELEYRKGKEIANADALSRLPVSTPEFDVPSPADVLLLESDIPCQIDSKILATLTKKDPTLSRTALWVSNGWPDHSPDERFQPYYKRRNELSVHRDCLLWGSRVIVPEKLQDEVLSLLHAGHPGIVRMKGLARSYVWWPKLDSHIETKVNSCATCQENHRAPAKAPVHSWERTEKPWSRLHIDFAGPFHGQVFFLVVDSHSKWLEVLHVPSMSASCTIKKLRSLFATHGLPQTIVSDNGATFTSQEFKDFLKKNQMRQVLVAPYHPSSNGQAERMVATTKQALKKIIHDDWSTRLARFLFSQHTLPCTATGKSPAELLMNRRLSSLLDRLHPDLNKVPQGQVVGAEKIRNFHPGEPVYVRNYTAGPAWTPAEVIETTGPVSYKAVLPDGQVQRRHVDQIRRRLELPEITPTHDPVIAFDQPVVESTPTQEDTSEIPVPDDEPPEPPKLPVQAGIENPVRRSQRTIRPPTYLKDYVCSFEGRSVVYRELN